MVHRDWLTCGLWRRFQGSVWGAGRGIAPPVDGKLDGKTLLEQEGSNSPQYPFHTKRAASPVRQQVGSQLLFAIFACDQAHCRGIIVKAPLHCMSGTQI